MMDKIKKTRSW